MAEEVEMVDEARDALEVGFPGDARVVVPGVLRTVARLLSSPEVNEESSGSASDDAVLLASPVFLTAVPPGGRVGGLFRLDPTVLVREVALEPGFDAIVDGRVLVDDAAGRRAPTGAVALVVVGLRGGTASLEPEEGALEAILRRIEEVGVEGVGNFFCCGLPGTRDARGVLSPAASLAEVGASILGIDFRGGLR